MKQSTVFINILAHNEEDVIGAAVESVLGQTPPKGADIRISVFANGCTDRTAEIVADMASHDPRIQLFLITKKGKVNALKESITYYERIIEKKGKGELDRLIYMDADVNFPSRDTLKNLYRSLDISPNLYLVSAYPSPSSLYNRRRNITSMLYRARSQAQCTSRPNVIRGACYVVRWEALCRVKFPEGLLSDDMYLECCLDGHFLMDYDNPVVCGVKSSLSAEVRRDLFLLIAREQIYQWRRAGKIEVLDKNSSRPEWSLTYHSAEEHFLRLIRSGNIVDTVVLFIWFWVYKYNEHRSRQLLADAERRGVDLLTYWSTQR